MRNWLETYGMPLLLFIVAAIYSWVMSLGESHWWYQLTCYLCWANFGYSVNNESWNKRCNKWRDLTDELLDVSRKLQKKNIDLMAQIRQEEVTH